MLENSGHKAGGAEVLPGGETKQSRIPTGIMIILGPFVGLLYVIALPFMAIATVAALAVRKIVGAVLSLVGKSVSFGWRPATAHLTGKKRKKERKS
jgi:hypothetical protein